MKKMILLLAMPFIMSALSGCHRKPKPVQIPPFIQKTADVINKAIDKADQISKKGEALDEEMATVYFDYDSDVLDSFARDILFDNSLKMKKGENWELVIEGYCDERGAVGYNLALGEKRGLKILDYYRNLGVDETKIKVISYGKEKPVCTESTEKCWAKCRRGVTVLIKK